MAAFESISTTTSASTTNLSVTGIPSTFKDLWGFCTLTTAGSTDVSIYWNGDTTASNYWKIFVNATSPASPTKTGNLNNATMNTGGAVKIGFYFKIINYPTAGIRKSNIVDMVCLSGTNYRRQYMISNLNNTDAISSLNLVGNGTLSNVTLALFGTG
jgi:hypothetical protein